MAKLYLYADESCHTKNHSHGAMSLVTVFCKDFHRKLISQRISLIMEKHNINPRTELKWTKISNTNVDMYIEIINFLKQVSIYGDLGIRAIYIKNKFVVDTDYNEWYHKMYYLLFKKVINDFANLYESFHVLIDYKDKFSHSEIPRMARFLEHYTHGWERLITTIANSKDHKLIQIADVIAGSITHYHRGISTSKSKQKLIRHIFNVFDISYDRNTYLSKMDFNYFIWEGKHA
jgi:hypothetical protein